MLLTDIEEIQEYVAINATSSIQALSPYLRLAERNYLVPVLGAAFLTEMEQWYIAASKVAADIPDKNRTVVQLAQEVISNLGVMHAMPVLSVQIGNSGVTVVTGSNLAPAAQWRQKEVYESLGEVGHKAVDALLSFLEAEKATYTTWAEDPSYRVYQQYFIRSAPEFSGYYNIRESRYLLHCIKDCMSRVEIFEIKKAVGAKLFDELKLRDKDGSLEGKMKQLLQEFLKPAIALFTVAKALKERLIQISAGNITIKFAGSTENMDESRAPQLAELNSTIGSLEDDARKWIREAQDFIRENADSFAQYATETRRTRRMNAKNDPTKGSFIF